MIHDDDVLLAGKVNKTHGIGGELSVSFFSDAVMDSLEPGMCLIMSIDGIYTPFFVGAVRPRSAEALLVTLDDVDSQEQAAQYVGRDVYMLRSDVAEEDDELDDDADGFYAGQLVGFKALDTDGNEIGRIVDIDESTENVLFVVERAADDGAVSTVYIPVADEFITDISTNNKSITFDLPEGLLSL